MKEGLDISREVMLQKKTMLLENQLEQLKEICADLYRIHSYEWHIPDEVYNKKWSDARRLSAKILDNSWNESEDILELYKAQALCYLGVACTEKGVYDEAVTNLNKARNLIEKQSAQYILPECYVRTCMKLAKCYMEKHSPSWIIDDCLNCARDVIREADDRQKRFSMFSLELKLQEAVARMDAYGQNAAPRVLEAMSLLMEAEHLMEQIFREAEPGELDAEWKKNMECTLLTTKADYYKKIYFKLCDEDLYQEIKGQLNDYFPENHVSGRTADEAYVKQICFEKAIHYFAKVVEIDLENTMGLSNIAAMLYDFKERKGDEQYLFDILKGNYVRYNTLPKTSVQDVINYFLDQTLEIEHRNMFALNIKAVLTEESRMSSTINHYQALRQSSLKQRFKSLEEKIGGICPEKLRNIMINLIILHSKVSEFLDAAIIDFSDEEWKNLEVGHYTRLEVLPKLINKDTSSRMRIQNVHHLNDTLEGVLFVDILREVLEEDQGAQESVVKNLLELYGSEKNGTVRNSVYMGSFTSRLDQLNMWVRYGDGGKGCFMQVDAAASFDNCAKISLAGLSNDESFYPYKMEDIKYPLYMVVYLPHQGARDLERLKEDAENKAASDKQDGAWWKRQAKLIGKLADLRDCVVYILQKIELDFQEIYKNITPDKRYRGMRELCNTIMAILDLVRFLIKSDYYNDEREYRIIQYSSNPEYDNVEEGIPKLFIPLQKELVYKKICFGPLVQNFDSQAAYLLNIKREREAGKRPETWKLEVCKSEINYR